MATEYAAADSALAEWAAAHGLHVLTEYKDEEVRSVEIVDDQGCVFQLWLEPRERGSFTVRVWDYQSRRATYDAEADSLRQALEAGYACVVSWLEEDGHSRTPV